MLLHYYILHHIARELQELAEGFFLTECFTQEKDTLHCTFESNSRAMTLEARFTTPQGAVFLRPQMHRAHQNTLTIFPELIGRTLRSVRLIPNERILCLHLPPYALYFVMFAGWKCGAHSSPANALVLQQESLAPEALAQEQPILNAFRSPQALQGEPFCVRTSLLHPSLHDCSLNTTSTTLGEALSTCNLMLGRFYAREVLRRLRAIHGCPDINYEQPLSSPLVRQYWDNILHIADDLRSACLQAEEFFLVRDATNAPMLSVCRLTDDVYAHSIEHY
ncbi:MAG: hypothetical protein RML40_10960, partial [Bacteroidota bacterium]|nr:hypothetical protein [Candidatus Kapabacteria bacterium]MDW8221034.1 hypothetical protein [Bacteroidota bacterium]